MVKALVAFGPDERPKVLDIAVPDTGPGDVRVRVDAAGVCHSDLSMVNGTIRPAYPVVLGHEASGTVVEVGDEVDDIAVGDAVVLNWAPPCRSCWFCRHGEPWLCSKVEGVVSTPRGSLADGTPLHVSLGVGAFAEETVVPRSGVVRLPGGVPRDVSALIGCAVLTGMGAARNTAAIKPGESVVVFGLGGVGLSAVAGAALAGAARIIAVDVSTSKEAIARSLGATDFLPYEDRMTRAIRSLTQGRGADHALECVGKPATIRAAWGAVRRGGRCTVVGVGRATDEVTFNAMELYHFARHLTSSVFGSCDPERDVPEVCRHVLSGAVDLSRLVTHRTDLAGVPDAFERMRRGDGVRTVVEIA
ncbi:alcohol dehydrogenase catalytic domain-containing protein [Streptomyces sp. NPDC004838]